MPERIDALLLLGWMEEAEALGFVRQSGTLEPFDEGAARQIWRQYRHRTHAAAFSRLYRPPDYRIIESEAAARFVAEAGGPVKVVIAVDPGQLLAFQFYLAMERVQEFAASEGTWAERCLPTERPRAALAIAREGNSLYFDVPHAEHVLRLTAEGELKVDQCDPYVKVADLGGGRLMLRAGYHRAYSYLRARPRPAEPFLAALTEGELPELDLPGVRSKMASDHPPLVGDFLTSDLAWATKIQKLRFRFQITAEMHQIAAE